MNEMDSAIRLVVPSQVITSIRLDQYMDEDDICKYIIGRFHAWTATCRFDGLFQLYFFLSSNVCRLIVSVEMVIRRKV